MGPYTVDAAIGGKPIDAILADPAWPDRIATDGQGPRVGALGHSAGVDPKRRTAIFDTPLPLKAEGKALIDITH